MLALPLVTPDVIIGLSLAMFFSALRIAARLGHGGRGPLRVRHLLRLCRDERGGAGSRRDAVCRGSRLRGDALAGLLAGDRADPAPSLVVAWLFVFALSFDDFLITFMTKGPGADTLPIKIYAQMRFGIKPQTSALFVVLFLDDARPARSSPAG